MPEYISFPRRAAEDRYLSYSGIKFILALYILHHPGDTFQIGKGTLPKVSNLSYSSVKKTLSHLSSLRYLEYTEISFFTFQISLPDCSDNIYVRRATAEILLARYDVSLIAVYFWIAADSVQGVLEIGMSPFCKEHNIAKSSFCLAIRKLEDIGVLRVERSVCAGGQHAANCYYAL